jgi:hypothetical protein
MGQQLRRRSKNAARKRYNKRQNTKIQEAKLKAKK